MHGTGNDYVYVDLFDETMTVDPVALGRAISRPHFGVGSDGLITLQPWVEGDGEMVMRNADGSTSEMCGNGLRCVAKLIFDRHARGKRELKLLTGAGVKTATITATDSAGDATEIRIDMGAPIFAGREIPTTLELDRVLNETLTAGDRTFTFSSVSMGNPHCVIFVDDVASFPVVTYGPLIENHPLFPRRVNVEFVQIVSRTELIQRTWERGAGETLACGTGASAVAVVSHTLGHTDDLVTIHLSGGDLHLAYDGTGSVRMTGGAVTVFDGDIDAAALIAANA